MYQKERIPFPSSKAIEIMGGETSEEKNVELKSGEKKFVRLIEKGGGLLGVIDKKEWAGILNHSLIVRRLATHLGRELKAAGEDIDLESLSEAALLHDVGKRREYEEIWYSPKHESTKNHNKVGAEMLKERGFSEKIVDMVDAHLFPEKEDLDTWEKKLVFYADMRVSQEILPLNERLSDLHKRWVEETKKITEEEFAKARYAEEIEKQIFSKLNMEHGDIITLPMSRDEKYLRTIVERNLEYRAIEQFKYLEKLRKNKEEKTKN